MRVHNPGVGEVLDRLSILALKRLHGRAAGKDIGHWEEEADQLQDLLRREWVSLPNTMYGVVIRLTVVNSALWAAEDELRDYREAAEEGDPDRRPSLTAVRDLAFRIQHLNDERTALVGNLNYLASGLVPPPEKVHHGP